jgi:hypothetical protein
LIALIGCGEGKGRWGGGRARRGSRGGAGSGAAARGRRKERAEGRLTRGPWMSAPQGKKKRGRREVGWCGSLDGPLGPSGLKGSRHDFSFFFFFFFKLHFQTIFHFKFKSNLFKLFLQNFINFLETTQATKNHESQLMMHKHLLSLSLLNYI